MVSSPSLHHASALPSRRLGLRRGRLLWGESCRVELSWKRWRHHRRMEKRWLSYGYWWLWLFMKLFNMGGCVWKCCVPLNPMVLLIIIPFLNGYFIGNIPYFQTNPYITMIYFLEKWRWWIVLNGYWWLILMLLMDHLMVITPWLWLLLIYQSSIWIWLSLMVISIFPYSLGPHS